MSSYKLQAKNKKTGEIVGFNIEEKSLFGFTHRTEDIFYTEKGFNELYDCVEEEIEGLKFISGKSITIQPEWENEWYSHFKTVYDLSYSESEKWLKSRKNKLYYNECFPESMCELEPKKVKQFISDTLQKERDRLVREIENIENPYNFCDVEWVEGADKMKEEIIKLIQNK